MDVSDRWAAFTMPGSLRRAKTVIVGSATMPNDPLEQQRSELADYEVLLNNIGSFCTTIQTAMQLFVSAPESLFEPLQRFFGEDNPNRGAIMRLCTQLSDLATGVRGAEAQIDALRVVLQEAHEKNKAARDAFETRDKAFLQLAHYETKVGKLHQQVMRNAASHRLSEKLNRNETKKNDSEQGFHNVQAEATRAVNATLSLRYQQISQALSKLCHYYRGIFQASERVNRELGDVAQQLVAPSATDAMARKAQELASQATERAANFAGNLRERFGGAGQSLSNKFGSLQDESGASLEAGPNPFDEVRGTDTPGVFRSGGATSSSNEPPPQQTHSPRQQPPIGYGGTSGPSTPAGLPTRVLGSATPPQRSDAGFNAFGGNDAADRGFNGWNSGGLWLSQDPNPQFQQNQQPQQPKSWTHTAVSQNAFSGNSAGASPWGAPTGSGTAHDRTAQFSGAVRPQSASAIPAGDPWAAASATTHTKGSATPPVGGGAPWQGRTPWA